MTATSYVVLLRHPHSARGSAPYTRRARTTCAEAKAGGCGAEALNLHHCNVKTEWNSRESDRCWLNPLELGG